MNQFHLARINHKTISTVPDEIDQMDQTDETNGTDEADAISCFRTNVPSSASRALIPLSEKHWHKYLTGLTEKQKEHLRERLAIFKEDVFDKRIKTHRLTK